VRLERADEDVAWEERLKVDEAVRMRSCDEYLEHDELSSHKYTFLSLMKAIRMSN
jgi:hypothetical protein